MTLAVAFAIRSRPITAKRLDVALDVANLAVALFSVADSELQPIRDQRDCPHHWAWLSCSQYCQQVIVTSNFMTMGPKRNELFPLEVEMRIAHEVEKAAHFMGQ